MTDYEHDLEIQMEEWFFGDVAKDEEEACPCCDYFRTACNCPEAFEESDPFAGEVMA